MRSAKTQACTGPAELPDIREILLHWDVVDPGLQLRVEELLPLVPDMKHQRTAEKEVFEAEARGHASEVEQIPAREGEECCAITYLQDLSCLIY